MKKRNILLGGLAVLGVSYLSYRKGRISMIEDIIVSEIIHDEQKEETKETPGLYIQHMYKCKTYEDVVTILNRLYALVDAHGYVTIAQVKTISGAPRASITDKDDLFGWRNLKDHIFIHRAGDGGYVFHFPVAEML
jgi:uncharacterized protein (UPF0297 family)